MLKHSVDYQHYQLNNTVDRWFLFPLTDPEPFSFVYALLSYRGTACSSFQATLFLSAELVKGLCLALRAKVLEW